MKVSNQKIIAAKASIAKKPKSKATALRWYLKDHFGLLHNQSNNDSREDFAHAIKEAKNRNAPAIIEICRNCVGGGADSNCRESIRNCQIIDCLLFNVRPYQLKSKVSLKNVMPCVFLRPNDSEPRAKVASTSNEAKKQLLNHLVTMTLPLNFASLS